MGKMRKWGLFATLALCICMAGCAGGRDNPEDGGVSSNNSNSNNDTNTNNNGSAEPSAGGKIDEKIDENLYVEAEFHAPEKELSIYSSELKQFDYDKLQSILWPGAPADKVTTDEFGSRNYGEASFGGERGSFIYRADEDANYIETLCFYAKEKKLISKKDLKFAAVEKATDEVEKLLSKFEIGCELEEPSIVALNGRDLDKVQKKIMEDDDYRSMLRAKNLGNSRFDSSTEIYYFEYSFGVNQIHVFGHDDPTVQYKGDNPLLAHNMRAIVMISNTGIKGVLLEGVLDKLGEKDGKAVVMDYEGIKGALEKKFGNVILEDRYKVTKIWMEYFPLIEADSFYKVNVIPVWCCDFEINGKTVNYTLRFDAITGDEIS